MAVEPVTLADLAARVEAEVSRLDRELSEIDLLVQQARLEASRHEQRRAQTAERFAAVDPSRQQSPGQGREQSDQLMTLTKRASLMEAQVAILEGKQKTLTRYRDTMRDLAEKLDNVSLLGPSETPGGDGAGMMPPAVSRAILEAQEHLRREISRQMHDGPAQSLTNIILRAQIVEQLMKRDPQLAQAEVGHLIEMVQQTLEATKGFIFDVRPMVLDDLGLVPTLRRAARERERRAGMPITFESVGADRRLGPELESGLFWIVDGATAGFLLSQPAGVAIRLEWSDEQLTARVSRRGRPDEQPTGSAGSEPPGSEPVPDRTGRDRRAQQPEGEPLPPALAAMIEQRRTAEAASATALAQARTLPAGVWKEIRERAATLELEVDLSTDRQTLAVTTRLPAAT
jgi:two-component system sensor histidine kinase DegS